MNNTELPLVISCQNQSLIGVLHKPGSTALNAPGVLVVVGGPQYRVGSHRQFVLMARYLCAQGIAVLRFDYRGIGDSDGEQRSFDSINEDIAAALSEFNKQLPEINRFVIWGLCDAAAAALIYAHTDKRICGLVLLNPWVHTEAGEAKAYLKNYYFKRLMSHDFWQKILRGNFNLFKSLSSFADLTRKSQGQKDTAVDSIPLPGLVAENLKRFTGQVLVILSGNNDYVAEEFKVLLKESKTWQILMSRPSITLQYFDEANHTFSRKDWRQMVEVCTYEWISKLK